MDRCILGFWRIKVYLGTSFCSLLFGVLGWDGLVWSIFFVASKYQVFYG